MSILNLVDDIGKLNIEKIKSKISPFDSFNINNDLLTPESEILQLFKKINDNFNKL